MKAKIEAATAARDAGISYRQLDYWASNRLIRTETNPGSGNPRTLTAHEARVLAIMADLVRGGLAPRQASKAARQIATRGAARLGGLEVREKGSAA